MTEKNNLKAMHENKVRSKIKKPDFSAQDSHKKKRIKKSWRKPDGSDSKMRRSIKGYRRLVKAGFGTANAIKDVSRKGYKIVKVASVAEAKVAMEENKKSEFPIGLEISSKVSKKNKVEIVKLAIEKKVQVLSVRNPEEFLKTVETELKARKDAKKARQEEIKAKEKKAKDAKKKASDKKEKKDLEKELDNEDAKDSSNEQKKEKKEKDKVLSKGE